MGYKPVATLGSYHACPRSDGSKPHVGGPASGGSPNVFINGKPALREGDPLVCMGPPDETEEAVDGVFVNGRRIVVVGQKTKHGGIILTGESNVQARRYQGPADTGSPGTGQNTTDTSQPASLPGSADTSSSTVETTQTAQPSTSPSPSALSQAIRNSRTPTEALGKLGQIEAKARLGHTTKPGYIDRYHGPDDITLGPDGQLTEWEAKGGKGNRVTPSKNSADEYQGSARKNKRRALQMTKDKAKRIGQPSKRQGGPYTLEEIGLWQRIFDRDGNKRHLITHTNVETGEVRVCEQDFEGHIISELDRFHLENFAQNRTSIEEAVR